MSDKIELSAETLKPCPFCGYAAEVIRTGTRRQSCIVSCTDCGATLESNETGAGRYWNTREPATLSAETLRRIVRSTARVAAVEDFTTDATIDEHLRKFVDIDALRNPVAPDAETLRRWRDAIRHAPSNGDRLIAAVHIEDEIDALLDGQAREECCVWREDESGEFWSGSCGVDWCFIDGGPVENKMHFCPGKGCGRPVREADNETGGE